MGDKMGRVHVQQPNLDNLQIRKNKKLLRQIKDEREKKSQPDDAKDSTVTKKLKTN